MNRDELQRLGALLFGNAWVARMADALEVDRRTVSRWIKGDAVPDWAAARIRAMIDIAPPPGTTDHDDRDDACYLAIEPDLTRLVNMATRAGWHRGEVLVAIVNLCLTDLSESAGKDAVTALLSDGISALGRA